MATYNDPGLALKAAQAITKKALSGDMRKSLSRGKTSWAPSTNLPVADVTSVMKSHMLAAKNNVRGGDVITQQVNPGTVTIEIPEGTWDITEVQALMGAEGLSSQACGLVIRGQGAGVSTLRFQPSAAGDMMWSRYWQTVHMEGLSITARTSGCTFLHINNANASAGQHWTFDRVEWSNFKYVCYLEGDNNGSEFTFHNCAAFQMKQGGAFLYIPDVATDQFLNYHFSGIFRYWTCNDPIVCAYKGGHFQFEHLDASDWANGVTSQTYLFELRGESHNLGVMDLKAKVRVEGKSTNAALLYSEWPGGNIDLSVDYGSQTFAYTYGNIITLVKGSTQGPQLYLHDSQMAGKIEVRYGINAWGTQPRVRVERCDWLDGAVRPTDVVTYTAQSANDSLRPQVEFVACRSNSNNSALDTAGMAVWDATVGYSRASGTVQQRRVNVAGAWGGLLSSDTATVLLPVGAEITGLRVVYPINSTGSALSGTVTLATTEETPGTIATVAVSSTAWDGFAGVSTQKPYLCDTAARAKVTVKSTVNLPTYALAVIEGYW